MDCAYHPGVQAVGYCSACGRAVCQACLTARGGRTMCPVCSAAAAAPPTPTPPAAAPVVAAPQPAATPAKSNTALCAGIGCCGLLLLVALAVGGYFAYKAYQKLPPTSSSGKAAPTTEAPKTETAPTTPAEPTSGATDATPASAVPGQAAAEAAARACHPRYGGQLKYRSADWRRVKLWMGPPGADLTTELVLQWNETKKAYEVERDAAIQRPPRATPKPGEAAAKSEALQTHPSWVAKIMYHSADWQRVKVWIGPPNSEFVSELILQWNNARNQYDVEKAGSIPREPKASPSRAGAIAAASRTGSYAWIKVSEHNGDWSYAVLLCSTDGDFEDTAVTVRWNGSGYSIVGKEWISGAGDADAWRREHPGEGDPSDPDATEPPGVSDDAEG